ncbi:hypothetical protein HCN44_008945 [Aphidius gifuensis]|uniref:Large ribosomal subunit protein bL27m n=1 Tax=Aphidius gifuensis TaxID=684658 RepID=A0A835CP78_APHGI|nr:39S ribosomal protein L27, mitochondrial [Aphidius gifuensis]KAF7991574.1 hypothetical protein HCN44_008945 [Aphidius gifuensis]
MSQSLLSAFNSIRQSLLLPITRNLDLTRHASKKAGSSTKNKGGNMRRPKHRGVRVQDGHYVQAGTILATQMTTRFHPGLHAGFGKNGTIFAIEAGRVAITCEVIDPNWEHTWIQRCYSGREGDKIYKKHFNVIPEKQHGRFKLVDTI